MADDEGHAQGRAAAAVEDAAVGVVELMDRRRFLLTSLPSAVAAPITTAAQPAVKVHGIGYLSASSATSNPRVLEAFQQGLRDLAGC